MKIKITLIALLLFLLSCKKETPPPEVIPEKSPQETPVEEPKVKSEAKVPNGFTVLAEVKGDLNEDGTEELVVVYDTKKETDMGTERQLHVYHKENNEWKPWMENSTVVLPSQHGGVMGDPFEGVQIENGAIVLNHFGGSREKWHYTHRFRYQDSEWNLIGATVVLSSPCEQSETLDYNVSTGKIELKMEKESCDENGEPKGEPKATTKSLKTTKTPIKMEGFKPGENKKLITVGKKKKEYYY